MRTLSLLTTLFLFAGTARAEEPQVLARGPVHEAFASPVFRAPRAMPVVADKPPDLIQEDVPAQKPDEPDAFWVPGYWSWDDESKEFIWISGTWRTPPPDRRWIPGYWNKTDEGWQWVPGYWAPIEQKNLDLLPAPPEPRAEDMPASPPTTESFYVPGIWIYRETRYVWTSGYWCGTRAGWIWVPSSYVWTPCGYVFVPGYWDYAFARRGLLFAPVRFARTWQGTYCPNYIVREPFLQAALFINLNRSNYWFGDYFGAGYQRRGYVSWVDFRYSKNFYDPTYAYYRHQQPAEWNRNLTATYAERDKHEDRRPPRTLDQQNNQPRVEGAPVKADIGLTRLDASSLKLADLSKEEVRKQRDIVAQSRDAEKKRKQIENAAIKERTRDERQNIRFDLPAAPPRVVIPKAPERPDRLTGGNQGPKVESPKVETPKQPAPKETPKPTPPKVDPPKETPKPAPTETPKPTPPKESPKPEKPKEPEKPKKDDPKPTPPKESPKPEKPKKDDPKPTPPKESPKPEKPKEPEKPKKDDPKPTPPKVDPPKETPKPAPKETPKPEKPKKDDTKPAPKETPKPEIPKKDDTKPEKPKKDDTKPAPPKVDAPKPALQVERSRPAPPRESPRPKADNPAPQVASPRPAASMRQSPATTPPKIDAPKPALHVERSRPAPPRESPRAKVDNPKPTAPQVASPRPAASMRQAPAVAQKPSGGSGSKPAPVSQPAKTPARKERGK